MSKRLLSLFMIVVMLFGMGSISYAESQADDIRYFEGTAGDILHPMDFEEPCNKARLEYSSSYISFWFTIEDIEHHLLLTPIEGSASDNNLVKCTVIYDGVDKGIYYNYYDVFSIEGDTVTWLKIGCGDLYLTGPLNLVEYFPGEVTQQISIPFTGTAVSDRGDYTLALAGYFEKELTDGVHELTPEEIREQTISIVAYNRANGQKRVMTQSTIEELTVTVSGGEVTQYIIRGRVQTAGGKLDRYTAVIDQLG